MVEKMIPFKKNDTFNLKIEVLPEEGVKLSVKRASDSTYTVLAHLTLEEMAKYPDASFATYRDGTVRLIVGSGCDVTIDNLKVHEPPVVIPDKELAEGVYFEDDFSIPGYTKLSNEEL